MFQCHSGLDLLTCHMATAEGGGRGRGGRDSVPHPPTSTRSGAGPRADVAGAVDAVRGGGGPPPHPPPAGVPPSPPLPPFPLMWRQRLMLSVGTHDNCQGHCQKTPVKLLNVYHSARICLSWKPSPICHRLWIGGKMPPPKGFDPSRFPFPPPPHGCRCRARLRGPRPPARYAPALLAALGFCWSPTPPG